MKLLIIEKIVKFRCVTLLIVFVLALLIVTVWLLDKTPIGREQYASFTRPDGHYSVLVTRNRTWLAIMPGQASDSPGVIWLLDKNGNTLNRADVEMVQLVQHVLWLDKKVSIKLIADWDLPD